MNRSVSANLNGFTKALLCSSALIGAGLEAAPAFAQSGAIEEIVVVARQRKEDIFTVPSQVTAFTAETIEAKGIQRPADFISAVPNVTFVETQNAGTSFLVIRGISQARNSEPSAAIVVDGVPMTQPAQFNQELIDIQQIEVLKGPQGALYGRNAIGGAILITTKQPTNKWEAKFTGGYESGPGGKAQATISGPITDNFKIRAAGSYFNTEGHLLNADTVDAGAKKHADPVENINGRISLLFDPGSRFKADLRLSADILNTRALYYTIPNFGTKEFNDPNFTNQAINLNNSGKNDRKIYDVALKLSYDTGGGTLSSITGYNSVWEILTGDGYTFDPFGKSRIFFDFGQSQFLNVKTFTEEVRFTSPSDRRFRYIAGAEVFKTNRFIATSNELDFGTGVLPIYRTPDPSITPTFLSFLADSQKQFAWAIYFDTTTSITKNLELALNFRFDSDHRENTTATPQAYLDSFGIPGKTGDKRSHTWSDFQPQGVLRWQASDNINLYVSYSRGFRSGGFNQTGVSTAAASAGFDNVGDLFSRETADTIEVGFKSRWLNRRLAVNGSIYTTKDKGGYYFVFLAANSTQNLGNIAETRYRGFDLDMNARITEALSANFGVGFTDSKIKKFAGPSSALVVGAKAPLVSDYTLSAGLQYQPHLFGHVDGLFRIDYNRLGPTTFVIPVPAAGEPTPVQRKSVDLVDIRGGLQGEDWSLTIWSKNLLDTKYNTEYSTGGFHFKAQPVRWGIDFTKKF